MSHPNKKGERVCIDLTCDWRGAPMTEPTTSAGLSDEERKALRLVIVALDTDAKAFGVDNARYIATIEALLARLANKETP
jgi:hypothetical protein